MNNLLFWCAVGGFTLYFFGWFLELTLGEIVSIVEAPIITDSNGFVIARKL
jgi:hypothetical protein